LPATASKSATESVTKPATKPSIKILYGESDEKALATHAADFKQAGHQVTTALNRQGVLEALRRDTFNLVILGATLSKDDRHHLPYMVRKSNAGTKTVVMQALTHHHEVDAAIDPTQSMPRILEKIAALVHSPSLA
jgi:DNA-binding NtrC family response regulator